MHGISAFLHLRLVTGCKMKSRKFASIYLKAAYPPCSCNILTFFLCYVRHQTVQRLKPCKSCHPVSWICQALSHTGWRNKLSTGYGKIGWMAGTRLCGRFSLSGSKLIPTLGRHWMNQDSWFSSHYSWIVSDFEIPALGNVAGWRIASSLYATLT